MCCNLQILDAGEVAAEFAHDVRSCFPTLVRRSPLAADSDDESGDDDSDSDTSRNDTRAAEVERKRLALESAEQQHTEAKRAASEFMAHTRVTLLRSLEELPLAFELHDHVNVCAALQQEEVLQCDELGGAPVQCQWLCVALPALSPSSSDSTTSRNGPAAPHNFALLFSYATTCVQKETETPFLSIPLPRTPRTYFESPAVDSDSAAADVFTDATVLSFGAKREATVHGGGKTPAETVHNIRLRHASGTFCTLVLPATTWDAIAGKYAAVVPPIYGELRLRRVLGPAANERLTLHLV